MATAEELRVDDIHFFIDSDMEAEIRIVFVV
jgi:hypothetical protein